MLCCVCGKRLCPFHLKHGHILGLLQIDTKYILLCVCQRQARKRTPAFLTKRPLQAAEILSKVILPFLNCQLQQAAGELLLGMGCLPSLPSR